MTCSHILKRAPYGIAVPDLDEPVSATDHATKKRFWSPQE
jgi:hypothetical protein